MTIANDEKFTIVKNFLFYTYHPDVFQADIDTLKKNQWQIDSSKSNDRKLTGTITAEDGQIMMTSIPYQPGWSIKVDGKRVDNLVEEVKNEDGSTSLNNQSGDSGQIVVVDAMIGLRLPAGTHTVTMTYTPPGWWIGMGTLAGGIILIVLFWFGDRKRYAAMLVAVVFWTTRSLQPKRRRLKRKRKRTANRRNCQFV